MWNWVKSCWNSTKQWFVDHRTSVLVFWLLVFSALWVVGVFKWVDADTNQGRRLLGIGPEAGPQTCEQTGFEQRDPGDAGNGTAPDTLVSVGTAAAPVSFDVGDARGATRTAVVLPMTSEGNLPPDGTLVEVSATPLSRDGGGTLPAPETSAVVVGDRLVVDICALVPPQISFSEYAGTYNGEVVVSDNRFKIDPMTVAVKVQARYIWLLAPFVVWIPLLAWVIAGKGGFWSRSGLASLLAAGVGAAGVYAASGISDPTWGGGIVPAATLLGLMFGAATGVLATANQAGVTAGSAPPGGGDADA